MKKTITILTVIFIAVMICLFSSCTFVKPGTETGPVTVTQTAETATRPELKVNLGVSKATAITETMMKQSGISKWVDECRGIYVSKMTRDSVLDKTEFRPGDIIQAIDGQETNTLDDVYNILSLYNPGDTITVSVFRLNLLNGENKYFEVDVTFPGPEEEAETSGDSLWE